MQDRGEQGAGTGLSHACLGSGVSLCPSVCPREPTGSDGDRSTSGSFLLALCPPGGEGPPSEPVLLMLPTGRKGPQRWQREARNNEWGSSGSRQMVMNDHPHFLLGENEAQFMHLAQLLNGRAGMGQAG